MWFIDRRRVYIFELPQFWPPHRESANNVYVTSRCAIIWTNGLKFCTLTLARALVIYL